MSTLSTIFRNRTFAIVWAGQSVSILGDSMFQLALMWWVVSVTGSATAMSTVALASALPRVVLGPLMGVYIDRVDRRQLMIMANAVNGFITLGMAVFVWQGMFSLTLIVAAAFLMAIMSTLHGPAFDATIPAIVEPDELVRVNALMQSSNSVIWLVAPAVSGVIVAVAGVGAAILADALTFFVAVLSLLLVSIPSPQPQSTTRTTFWADTRSGFHFVLRHSLLMPLLVFFAVVNLALAPMSLVIPILVADVLKGGPALVGLFWSFQAGGMLGASTMLSMYPCLARRNGLILITATAGIGMFSVVIASIPHPFIFLAGAAGVGFVANAVNITSQSIWQKEVPANLRGRVFATRRALSSGLKPLGLAVSGPLTDLIGVQWLMGGAGALCAIVGLCGFAFPCLWRYPDAAKTATSADVQAGTQ